MVKELMIKMNRYNISVFKTVPSNTYLVSLKEERAIFLAAEFEAEKDLASSKRKMSDVL